MGEFLFNTGEKVVVKQEYREYIKHVYSDTFFTPQKMKLGLAAANGEELVVVECNEGRIVLENKQINTAILNLEPKYFEPAEEDIDVSEFFK